MAFCVFNTFLRRYYCGQHIIQKSMSSFRTKNQLLRTKMINIAIYRFSSEEKKEWVTIIFEKPDGTQLERFGKIGDKVQQVIGKDNPDFPGYGECDGTMSCSCCHVILSEEDFAKYDKVKTLNQDEEDLIISAAIGPTPTSRLGCCLTIVSEMDGIVLKLPPKIMDIKQQH